MIQPARVAATSGREIMTCGHETESSATNAPSSTRADHSPGPATISGTGIEQLVECDFTPGWQIAGGDPPAVFR